MKKIIIRLTILISTIYCLSTPAFAVNKVLLSLSEDKQSLNIQITPYIKGLHYSCKLFDGYLIITFNKQIEYSLKSSPALVRLMNYSYRSLDKRSVFIKLGKGFSLESKVKAKDSVIKLRKSGAQNAQSVEKSLNTSFAAKVEDMSSNLGKVEITNSDGDYITLSFEWPNLVGCVAFSRGQYSWVAFNSKKEFDTSVLSALGIFEEIKIIENPDYTVFRFKHSLSGELKVEEHDNKWSVTFARDTKIKILPGSLINEVNSLKVIGKLFDARDSDSPFNLRDEITGDELILIPVKQSDMGVAITRNFVDYSLLKSAQGMVIRKISEEVKAKSMNNGVEIISPNYSANINLYDKINQKTREILKKQAESNVIRGISNYTMLPLFEVQGINNANFLSEYYKRLADISSSNPINIDKKRYNLARFFFMHEMYPETLAILGTILEDNPRFMRQYPEAWFLQAVSYTLSNRFDDAEKIYKSLYNVLTDKRNKNEISIWLNLNNVYKYNSNNYIGLLEHEDNIIFTYPDNLYWRIALEDLETAIKNDNIDLAERIFSSLRVFNKNDFKLVNNIRYLRAKYYISKHEIEKAKQHLNTLKFDNKDPYNQVRAQIELLKLQLESKEIDRAKAIAELNNLKQIWKGDFLEYNLLMLIAKLYRENHQFIEALRTYKYIIESSTLQTDQLFITAEMIGLFNKIFAPGGLAETMSDFDTVSLFYEFKELTPIGKAGDNIVLQIASRLVNLDLLETAEALLKHQVSYRLIGEKRINVGNQLAYIYLTNKKPMEAIKILENTDKDNYTYAEYLKRLRLKAKAYSDMGNFEYAINLLKNDRSVSADLLREEIYFKTHNWTALIDLLEPYVQGKINRQEEFFLTDKQELLRLLIAYLFNNEYDKLKILQNNVKTNNIDIQNLLDFFGNSEKWQEQPINYKAIDNSLNIKNIEKFLNQVKNDLFNHSADKADVPSK